MRIWHRWHFPGKKRNSCFSMYILKFSKAFSFADWDQKKLFSDVVIHMLLKNIHRHRDHRFMTSTSNFWNLPRFFGFHRFQIIDILFFFVDGGSRGSQNSYIFVDVINLWPHSLNLSSFIYTGTTLKSAKLAIWKWLELKISSLLPVWGLFKTFSLEKFSGILQNPKYYLWCGVFQYRKHINENFETSTILEIK